MDKVQIKKLATLLAYEIKVSRALIDREGYIDGTLYSYDVGYEQLTTGYVDVKQFSDLVKLYELLLSNRDLDQDNLNKLLNVYPISFGFLRKLNHHYENLARQLLVKGPRWMLITYCGDKRFGFGDRVLDI